MMMKMWNWYQNSLSVHPVKTQAISSAILWGVGDLSAQYITHSAAPKKLLQLSDSDAKFTINWNRLAVTKGGVWPVVQVFNFWYVPVKYQLLYVNFYLLDCAFLSWLEQQKDAPWKKLFASFHSTNEKGGHRCGEG
uniref:Uncharacterized protein n=1 Tax=Glycine max TaxID=3847 RepID=A0A0R0K098_SOYBN